MMTQTPAAERDGTRILAGKRSRYELIRPLAEGGFGITHLARRLDVGTQVVVKQLRMDRLADWKAFELFEREAAVLESLRHPNIPAFIDHFQLEEGDTLRGFALVQEYVAGKTLREAQGEKRPGASAMRRWFTKLLEICEYLHGLEPPVIHRDITPKNIMLRDDGEAVLIDFGTVQHALRSADTISSTSAGTFGYAAPEQLIGRALPTSDLYGLAMTYLAIASGREPEALPFAGGRVQVSESLRDHDTHPRLVLLLEEMLDPDAARRPASAADVLGRLRAIPVVEAPTPSAALAPVTDETPLARVERLWRARAARAARLGREAPMPAAQPETEYVGGCVIDETGRRALLELGHRDGNVLAIDLATFETTRFVEARELEIFHPEVVFDADGQTLMLSSFGTGVLVIPTVDGGKRVHRFEDLTDLSTFALRKPGAYALSPDQGLFAFVDRRSIVAVDVATGKVAQRIEPEGGLGRMGSLRGTIRFVPDGSAVLHEEFRDTQIVDPKGSVQALRNTIFAFGHDGRTAARATDAAVEVGGVASWAPFSWRGEPRQLWKPPESVNAARFSPDDRFLALVLGSGRVVVLEVGSGEVVLEAADPYRPGLGIGAIEHVAFAADGRRLFVIGDCTIHPLATERQTCIAVYSITQRKPLGTLRRVDDEDHLYGFTTLGPHGPLGAKRGKRSEMAHKTRALLLDSPPDEGLGRDFDGALDFEDRVFYWGGLLRDKRIAVEQDLRPLVAASAGLTHLLPLALERTITNAGDAPPRFGQAAGEGTSLPIPPLVRHLEWLSGKNPAEREVLFEDMLASILAAQAAEQAERDQQSGPSRAKVLFFALGILLVTIVLYSLIAANG